MDEFTIEERERINQLYASDFANASPDDVKLIQRWEEYRAKTSAEFEAKNDMLKAELEEKTRISSEQANYAMQTLDDIKEAALARLKAVEVNG